MESKDGQNRAVPFQYTIELHGPQGEIVRVKSTFDDGAMVNAIDLRWFEKIKHRLKPLEKSEHILRMADGRLVASEGVWNGEITINSVSHNGNFQVFDSNGAWSALFGKPLLKKFKAVHDYELDVIKIPKGDSWVELKNQCEGKKETQLLTHASLSTNGTVQRNNFKGDRCASPSRQVPNHTHNVKLVDAAEISLVQETTEKKESEQEPQQDDI
jgi:hypothetical protein